jgi:inorganic pyrophosphatase
MNIVKSEDFLGKIVTAVIDRPLGSRHPVWAFTYPVNYGYVPNTLSPDGEPLDAYVLGVSEPMKEFTGRCIAVIHRLHGDDKLVLVPEGKNYADEEIKALTEFQERFFHSTIVR